MLRQPFIACLDPIEFPFREFFNVEQGVVRLAVRPDQFVQLELQCLGVAVLGILDEEHHQKGDDGGGSIDYELPGITESKERASHCPAGDKSEAKTKGRRVACRPRGGLGEALKWARLKRLLLR